MRNMKTMIRVSVIAFAMIFTAGFLGVYGTMSIPAADKAYAANDGYTYTVTVYSGKEGYFDGDENKHSKKLTGEAKYGQPLTIEMDDLDLTIIDPDKYYPRGVKPAGHDNDEVSDMTYQSYTFTVTKDEAFAVAYGMKGGMVKYTVRYVDDSGNTLISAKEYYGMPGDKPVVSCKYVEGFIPNALNITKRLTADASQNVFTFTYSRNQGVLTDEGEVVDDGQNGANGNAANANAAANAPGAYVAGNADNANDGNNRPANLVDLDDNEPPLASVDKDKDGGISGATMGLIGIVIAGILIALGLLYLILRRRGEEEE